jgi:hypothetical protein
MPTLSALYLAVIVPAFTFIPITMGVCVYHNTSRAQRAILVYLGVAVVVNCIASIYSRSNNLPLLHLYTAIEFVLLLRFYQYTLPGKRIQQWIRILRIAFPVGCVVNALFIQSIYSFNTYTRPVEAIILLLFSLLYMMHSAKQVNQQQWTRIPENWSNAGILIYFSGALSQFTFSNIAGIQAPHDIMMIIWDIHATLVLVMYISCAIGFSKCRE